VLAGAALAELLHDRIHARLSGGEAQVPVADAAAIREAQRAELIEDLRVVLREELDTIQTFRSSQSGGQPVRGQGTAGREC
jgi:hypothetical protein